MLETLREYGLELLATRQEDAAIWRAYTDYYLALAEAAEAHLLDAPQQAWILGLTQEYENVLNALQWLLATGQGEAALCLSSALERFWWMRGLLDEGLSFLEQALALPGDVSRALRARGLTAAGFLAIHFDDMRHTEELLSECVFLLRELEDELALAYPLGLLGYAAWGRGAYPLARTLLEEALHLTQKHGDDRHTADALIGLAFMHVAQGDCAQAWVHAEEAVALFLHLGDDMSATLSRITLGWVAASQQNLARARLLVEEAVVRSRARHYPYNLAYGLPLLGLIMLWQGEMALASPFSRSACSSNNRSFTGRTWPCRQGAWEQLPGDRATLHRPLPCWSSVERGTGNETLHRCDLHRGVGGCCRSARGIQARRSSAGCAGGDVRGDPGGGATSLPGNAHLHTGSLTYTVGRRSLCSSVGRGSLDDA